VKKLLVDGFTTKIACPTGSFRVLVYPSGVDVSTSTLRYLSACLRTRRRAAGIQRPDALYAIAATTMTNTASKFARLGSSRSSPVAASNLIPGWACTAGSLSRVSPYCTGFRRLRIRWEIRDDIDEAFLRFACAIICWRRLHNISNC
jgi:hypothetical protein